MPQLKEGNHYNVIKGVLYRSGNTTCFFFFLTKQNFPLQIFKNKIHKTLRSLEV